ASPNGRLDFVRVRFSLGADVDWVLKAERQGASPEVVRTWAGFDGEIQILWDGKRDDLVTIAPDGDYKFKLYRVSAPSALVESAIVNLDTTPPTAHLNAFVGSQHDLITISGSALDPAPGAFDKYELRYAVGPSFTAYTRIQAASSNPV